jgi:hypothetical protein
MRPRAKGAVLAAAVLLMPAAGAAPAPPKTIAVDGIVMTGMAWAPKTIEVGGIAMTGMLFAPKTIPVDGITMTGMAPAAAGTPRR